MKIAVVILAGGEGTRIGGDKPQRLLGGKRLIDRAEVFARRWSDTLAVAVRDAGQVGPTSLSCIFDDPGIEGPLAGLAAALRFAEGVECDAVLTIPADSPFLPDDLGRRLEEKIGGASAAIASSGGHLHPVCGLWRVSAHAELADYLASGRRALRGFAEAIGFRAIEWPDEPTDPFFNINSAQDLADAERRLGG